MAAAALLLLPAVALGEDAAPAFTARRPSGRRRRRGDADGSAAWTGTPDPTAKYTWRRCRATGGSCDPIAGNNAPQYVVTTADVGFRLGVRITLKNKVDTVDPTPSVTTDVVVAASIPTPSPTRPASAAAA